MDYANHHHIILEINEKNESGLNPLISATNNDNIEIFKLLIDYATKNKIILEINEKENEYGIYPLLNATENNNIELVKLLIDYANHNNIILNINEKNEIGWYPVIIKLFWK